jgi:hypothetical protein
LSVKPWFKYSSPSVGDASGAEGAGAAEDGAGAAGLGAGGGTGGGARTASGSGRGGMDGTQRVEGAS